MDTKGQAIMHIFELVMWAAVTPIVGMFVMCFLAGFLSKVLNFTFKVEGFFSWIISASLGWTFLKMIGAY